MGDLPEAGARNAIVFFEIPARDFERAHVFYSQILATELEIVEKTDPPRKFAALPIGPNGVGGAVVAMEGMVPSQNGTLVYLDGSPDLQPILERALRAGGRVLVPKTLLQENCYFAQLEDCEGNRIGLFSPS